MQRSTFHHLNRLLFGLVIGAICVVGATYAVGTYLEGWRTTGDVNQRIADHTNTCKLITGPKDYFVPSRTGDEWNSFAAVAGSKGFMIAECPIDGGWSGWSGYSACNASCGGGTQTRTRTCNNPTPANGGATCAGTYSESIACNTQSCVVVVNGSCGGGANTCAVGSPSGYAANNCGPSKTWSCIGSGGGTTASCSLANAACVTRSTKNCNPSDLTYNNGQTWCSDGNLGISVQCPAGYHYLNSSRVATPFFPGVGNCMGNNVAVNTKINSEGPTGNGYEVDFDAYNTTAAEHPTLPGYIWDRSGNDINWFPVDYHCGGGSLVITCEPN